jgi:hypothetical protein
MQRSTAKGLFVGIMTILLLLAIFGNSLATII